VPPPKADNHNRSRLLTNDDVIWRRPAKDQENTSRLTRFTARKHLDADEIYRKSIAAHYVIVTFGASASANITK
jgi:hypothetical protein